VNVSSLKPVDENEIKEYASNVKGIVTAEELLWLAGWQV